MNWARQQELTELLGFCLLQILKQLFDSCKLLPQPFLHFLELRDPLSPGVEAAARWATAQEAAKQLPAFIKRIERSSGHMQFHPLWMLARHREPVNGGYEHLGMTIP